MVMSVVNRIITVVSGCIALVAALGWAATLVDRAGAIPFDDDRLDSAWVDAVDQRNVA